MCITKRNRDRIVICILVHKNAASITMRCTVPNNTFNLCAMGDSQMLCSVHTLCKLPQITMNFRFIWKNDKWRVCTTHIMHKSAWILCTNQHEFQIPADLCKLPSTAQKVLIFFLDRYLKAWMHEQAELRTEPWPECSLVGTYCEYSGKPSKFEVIRRVIITSRLHKLHHIWPISRKCSPDVATNPFVFRKWYNMDHLEWFGD